MKCWIFKFVAGWLMFAGILCAGFEVRSAELGSAKGTNGAPGKRVLFVCTGNYYRSRFAEVWFNERAKTVHLEWRAVSRGLRIVASQHGISALAERELVKRGVAKELCGGEPRALTGEDLAGSDYVVLMDEAEHRPMMEKLFPGRDGRLNHYWHIEEAGRMSAPKACQAMASEMEELIRTLAKAAP